MRVTVFWGIFHPRSACDCGYFSFAILRELVMPGMIGVHVLGARSLPVMDKSAEMTDAFVEVCFGSTSYKTAVFAKSPAP